MATDDEVRPGDDSSASLRLVLDGSDARLGEVPAADLTRLIDGAIRAVARAAELIAGRQPGRVGRRGTAVENATRFRFVNTFAGSVGVLLRGPDARFGPDAGLELDDPTLTELALLNAFETLSGAEREPHIARAWVELADDLDIGTRYSGLQFTIEGRSFGARAETLDRSARTRLHRVALREPAMAASVISGTLVEADFERHTARLRTSSNRTVRLTFDDTHADDVQEALRRQAEFDGVVTYDEKARRITAVDLRAVRRTHQLGLDLGSAEFWRAPTIADLADEQGVGPADLTAMRDETATVEELERFFEALDL